MGNLVNGKFGKWEIWDIGNEKMWEMGNVKWEIW